MNTSWRALKPPEAHSQPQGYADPKEGIYSHGKCLHLRLFLTFQFVGFNLEGLQFLLVVLLFFRDTGLRHLGIA